MLAIVAFVLEVSPLGKPKYSSHIAFAGNFGEGRTLIHEGDTVIHSGSSREKYKEQREKQKPDSCRGEIIEKPIFSNNELPANNTNQNNSKIGLWDWNGFERDEPRPRIKSLSDITKKLINRRSGRPKRKNI